MAIFLIILTVAISLGGFNNQQFLYKMLLYPHGMQQPVSWYRMLTSGFVHADYVHLIFNMYTFYFFGEALEGILGIPTFLTLYLSGIIIANIPSLIKHRNHTQYSSLGASGGVSAIVFAYIYLFPWQELSFALLPFFHFPAIVFALVYLAITFYLARRGGGNINHDAHLWGSIYGVIFLWILDPTKGASFWQQLVN